MARIKGSDFDLESFPDHFKINFKLLTDYQNVDKIFEVGSMKLDLPNLAMEIFYFCTENSMCLKIEWIPRTLNTTADQYRKIFDFDDWSLSDRIFHYFNKILGPFSLDRFANSDNA